LNDITVARAAGVICTATKMMIAWMYRIARCFIVKGLLLKKERGIYPSILTRYYPIDSDERLHST
jgi:hypothetical protein